MYIRPHPLQVQARGVGCALYLGGHNLCGLHSLHIRPALLQRGSVHRSGTCSKCCLRRRFVPGDGKREKGGGGGIVGIEDKTDVMWGGKASVCDAPMQKTPFVLHVRDDPGVPA